MALTVGELVAYIRADSQQFDRAVDDSGRKFSGLASAIGSGVKVLAGTFTALAGAAAGVGAAVFRVGADYNRLQQTSRAALTALLGSAEAANAQMNKLDEWARQSPFAKQTFIQAQQQLLGFGVEVEKVLPTLDAIQNAVAATGGSNQQILDLTATFAKISAAGKITGQDLIEFGNRGVDAATLIGSRMGKTGAQIREDITAGSLDAQAALDALVAGMTDRFGGATANIKQQFDGATDRIKGAWRDIGSILAAPFIDPRGGGRAVEWANKVADALRALEQKAGPLVDIIVKRMAPAFDAVIPTIDRVMGRINAWDLRKVNGQLDTLAGYAPLIGSVGGALVAMGSVSLPVIGKFVPAINPVVAALAGLVATSPEVRALGYDVLDALSPLVPVARDLGKVTADTAMAVLRELTPALRDLLMAAAPVVTTVGLSLAPALVAVVQAAEPLAHLLAEVVRWVADLPTPVLAAAAAFALLHSPIGGVITAVGQGLAGAFATAAQTWQASQGVADALGRNVGFIGTAAITARAGVSTLGTALKVAFISNPVGLAVTALTTAIGVFVGRQAEARQKAEELRGTLDQTTAAITEQTRAWVYNDLQTSGVADAARRIGISMRDLVDAALDPASDAYQDVARRMEEYRAEERRLAAEGTLAERHAFNQAQANRDLVEVYTELGGVQQNVADEQANLREEIEATRVATDTATGAVRGQNDALRENIDLQDAASGRALSLREAQLRSADAQQAVRDAIARYNEVMADSEATDDAKAQALRDVEQALLSTVRGYQTEQDAMARNNATARELWDTVKAQREAFIEQATAIVGSREEAERLADQYGLIPDQIVTNLIAETTTAAKRVDEFLATYNGRSVTIRVHTQGGTTPYVQWVPGNANGALVEAKRFAGGGFAGDGSYVPRVPQIAQGGRNIMWAEPETGWEAYVSGKPSMRARNLAVLAEAADRLGYMVLPKGVAGYASGHITPAAPTAQPASLDGMQISGSVRLVGDGLLQFVDARISRAQSSRTSTAVMGVRR